MVPQTNKLPEDFVPFAELTVCGNVMRGGKALFCLGDKVPLLVGKNSHPKLWLSAPRNPEATHWIDLISAGRTRHPGIEIIPSRNETDVSVHFFRQPLLKLQLLSPDSVNLPFLDLRPIGLKVFGKNDLLYLGSHVFSKNSFDNVTYMVNLFWTDQSPGEK